MPRHAQALGEEKPGWKPMGMRPQCRETIGGCEIDAGFRCLVVVLHRYTIVVAYSGCHYALGYESSMSLLTSSCLMCLGDFLFARFPCSTL